IRSLRLQENSPAIFRHLHITKFRPPVRLHANRRPQINVISVALVRPHVIPPTQIRRLPMFQCALQHAISPQVHIVRNLLCVINHGVLPIVLACFVAASQFADLFTRRYSESKFAGSRLDAIANCELVSPRQLERSEGYPTAEFDTGVFALLSSTPLVSYLSPQPLPKLNFPGPPLPYLFTPPPPPPAFGRTKIHFC